jgi:hypothetical protein
MAVVNQAVMPGRKGEPGRPRGPHNVHARTHGTDDHGTRESSCGQNGEARPGTRSKSRDGATRRNRDIRRPRGWRRDSHPSVNNKEEMNHHFIH